jgi:hypothetical protein
MYRIEGKYHHHPQEFRLSVQWKLYAIAAFMAFAAMFLTFAEGMVFVRVEEMRNVREKRGEVKGQEEGKGYVVFGQRLSDKELVETWRKLKLRRLALVICAGVTGVCGFFVLPVSNRPKGWWIG